LGSRGSGLLGPAELARMMPHTRTAALGALLLLATSLGSGSARLEAQTREALVTEGQQLFNDKGCYGCHTLGRTGTPIGPDLTRVPDRNPEATLARWLRDPAAQDATRHMPNLQLSEAEARALAAYLSSLR